MDDTLEALEAARRRRRDLYEAMVEVESAAQAPVGTGIWRSVMLGELDDLSTAFESHVTATEADDGIIASIVEDEPRLMATGEHLKREHLSLRDRIGDVTEAVRATFSPTSPDEAESVRELVLELFIALSRHRQRGSDFVWEAYDVDIGGGS